MDNKRIAELYRQIAKEFESGGVVEPPIVQPTPQPIPEQPSGKHIDLLLYFVNVNFAKGEYIDVEVNGTWHNLSQLSHESGEWDVRVFGSRGVVIQVPNAVNTIRFRDSQIRRAGLPLNGYGFFSYKIGAKPIDFDLFNPVESPEYHPSFWARWERVPTPSGFNEYADLISANGAISGSPNARIDGYDVPPEFNSTGKMAVIMGMVGRKEWS